MTFLYRFKIKLWYFRAGFRIKNLKFENDLRNFGDLRFENFEIVSDFDI